MVDNFLKWTATAILIVGTGFNSFGIYPLGAILLVLGGIFWSIVSIRWKEMSMIITNLVMTATGIIGLIFHYVLN